MIPINDKEEKTAVKNEENIAADETAAAAEQTAGTATAEETVKTENAEGTPSGASGENSEAGEVSEEEGMENAEEEADDSGDESEAEPEAAGKTGLKGAFLNHKQKKEEKKAEKELEKLRKELADKANEMAVLNDKYLRICAEYDNFRKRSQKEKDSLYGDIRSNVITGFLPVFDNLERALAAHTEDEAYAKGVEMIMNQFNKTLEKLGVEEIPSLGQTFDPAVHNAVMHVDDETKGENEIVEVFQKGFRIGDKIIRFSMVKVAN